MDYFDRVADNFPRHYFLSFQISKGMVMISTKIEITCA